MTFRSVRCNCLDHSDCVPELRALDIHTWRVMRSTSALLIFILLLTCACLSVNSSATSFPTITLLEAVPDVVQTTDYSCGPSSLVAVLAYYGITQRESKVILEAKTNPEIGAEREDLAEVAESYGLTATVRDGLHLADLERELSQGFPVIILNQSWTDALTTNWKDNWEDGHYLVVIGMDAASVYVEDPLLDGVRGYIPRREFVERWHDWTLDERPAHGQAILIHGVPPARTPRAIKQFMRVH